MWKWLKSISGDGLRELVVEGVRAWLWPPLSAAVIAVLAVLDGYPLTIVVLSAGAMFALVANGLLRFSEWNHSRNPKNKVDFAGPHVGIVPKRDDVSVLMALNFGFQLKNNSTFPVEIHVDRIRTSFGRWNNPQPKIKHRDFTIGADGILWFDDDDISVEDVDLKNKMEDVYVDFSVSYGTNGNLKHTYAKRFTFPVVFNEEGRITEIGKASDVREG